MDFAEKAIHFIKEETQLIRNPDFAKNLCLCSLYRHALFVASGMALSILRTMNHIASSTEKREDEFFSQELPAPDDFDKPLDWIKYRWCLQWLLEYAVSSHVNKAEALLNGVSYGDNLESVSKKAFNNWKRLGRHADSKEERSLWLTLPRAYRSSNVKQRIEEIKEWEFRCKYAIALFWYRQSLGDRSWDEEKRLLLNLFNYFRECRSTGVSDEMNHELDCICDTLLAARSEDHALDGILDLRLSAFPEAKYLSTMWSKFCTEEYRKYKHTYTEFYKDNRTVEALYVLLLKENLTVESYEGFWQHLLRHTIFSIVKDWQYLDPNQKGCKDVVTYILNSLEFDLERSCYRSAFGRNAYSLRKHEVLEIVFDKLHIGQGDKFLDLFANIPVASWIASILGAEVVMVDCAFAQSERFARFYAERKKTLEELANSMRVDTDLLPSDVRQLRSLLDKHFDFGYLPSGGIGSGEKVVPGLPLSVSLCRLFTELVGKNPPREVKHLFGDVPGSPQEIPDQSDNYFNKALVDPPYGYETGNSDFGPNNGIKIAKLSIKEVSRVLQQGGRLVLTLPSYAWEKARGFPTTRWRQEVLEEARRLGFAFDSNSIRQGRALVLMEKSNP